MKAITLAAAAALCAAVILNAADETAPVPASSNGEAKRSAPAPPAYRVISAKDFSPDQTISGEMERKRESFEKALNKAHAEGCDLAGMNDDWVVLERRTRPVSEERRRVVLPQP